MADYQRFISYMYLYEGDIRGRNTGFVKVESRGCYRRIEAVVRRQPLLDGLASVWVFYRQGKLCRGVLLGRMTISGGNGNFLWSSLRNTVETSECTFEQLAGLLIWSEKNSHLCVTLWDDEPFSMVFFSPEEEVLHVAQIDEPRMKEKSDLSDEDKWKIEQENNAASKMVQDAERDCGKEACQTDEQMAAYGAEEEKSCDDEWMKKEESTGQDEMSENNPQTEEQSDMPEEKSAENATQEETLTGEEGSESVQEPTAHEIGEQKEEREEQLEKESGEKKQKEEREEHPKKESGERKQEEEREEHPKKESGERKQEEERKERPKKESGEKKQKEEREEHPKKESGERKQEEEREERPKKESGERKQEERELDVDLESFFPQGTAWERLCQSYPKIRPFVWNKEWYCLKIKPGDLGRLPRENWVLGNNSFMLHGYYVHRYLILMQIYQDEKERYILGVPGIYGNRERMMAEMFGFGEFLATSQKRKFAGQRGFWCINVTV